MISLKYHRNTVKPAISFEFFTLEHTPMLSCSELRNNQLPQSDVDRFSTKDFVRVPRTIYWSFTGDRFFSLYLRLQPTCLLSAEEDQAVIIAACDEVDEAVPEDERAGPGEQSKAEWDSTFRRCLLIGLRDEVN